MIKMINMVMLFFVFVVLTISISSAQTLTRTIPSTTAPGSTFIVSHNTVGAPAGKWFVAWDDTINGGCTPINYKSFMVSETGGDSSITKTFTAPATNGLCTFSGYYQFTDGVQKNFIDQQITIGDGGTLCGNGVIDTGEQCDGTNPGVGTCTTQGFTGGVLSCSSSCNYDTSACTGGTNNILITSKGPTINNLTVVLILGWNGGVSPYSIEWQTGDGATESINNVSANSYSLSHTYTSAGTYNGNVCVNDGDLGTQNDCDSLSVTVGASTSTGFSWCSIAEKVAFFDVPGGGVRDCQDGTIILIGGLLLFLIIFKK